MRHLLYKDRSPIQTPFLIITGFFIGGLIEHHPLYAIIAGLLLLIIIILYAMALVNWGKNNASI